MAQLVTRCVNIDLAGAKFSIIIISIALFRTAGRYQEKISRNSGIARRPGQQESGGSKCYEVVTECTPRCLNQRRANQDLL